MTIEEFANLAPLEALIVQQRIGRTKQKYPSIHRLHYIMLDIANAIKIVKSLHWQKDVVKARNANKKLGSYV